MPSLSGAANWLLAGREAVRIAVTLARNRDGLLLIHVERDVRINRFLFGMRVSSTHYANELWTWAGDSVGETFEAIMTFLERWETSFRVGLSSWEIEDMCRRLQETRQAIGPGETLTFFIR